MSSDEAAIICGAVENADIWGASRITIARKALEDAGYVWTWVHEQFIDDEFVDETPEAEG